jgi:hypothetical protein
MQSTKFELAINLKNRQDAWPYRAADDARFEYDLIGCTRQLRCVRHTGDSGEDNGPNPHVRAFRSSSIPAV